MSRGRTLVELVRDRLRKQGWYDTADYWDMKARNYSGLARSNWPSNTYNERVHARQMQLIDSVLGDVRGQRIADVGCGTGRASLHLAKRGAVVTGWDFSEAALEVARADARAAELDAEFVQGDVSAPPPERYTGSFDAVMTIGCLTLACKAGSDFDRAAANLARLVKPGGTLLFLEPVHSSRLLRRILKMSVDEWVARCERLGLELVERRGVCFVPSRYALAFRELPAPVVDPVFHAGERVLDASPRFERLSDYKLLVFRRPDRAHSTVEAGDAARAAESDAE